MADVTTGGFTLAATGKTCSKATLDLIQLIERAGIKEGLILADKEHFTQTISDYFHHHPTLDMLIPAPNSQPVTRNFDQINYQPLWAGYAIGETTFSPAGASLQLVPPVKSHRLSCPYFSTSQSSLKLEGGSHPIIIHFAGSDQYLLPVPAAQKKADTIASAFLSLIFIIELHPTF